MSTFPRPSVPRNAFGASTNFSTNFPPPPRRAPTAQTRADYQDAFKSSPGTARFKPKPPTAQQAGAADDAQQRANNFYAWQNMGGSTRWSQAPPPPPRPAPHNSSSSDQDNPLRREQSAWETFNKNKAQRSSTMRTPKKPMGFDPAAGADEPQARGTSAYFTRPHAGRMQSDIPAAHSDFQNTAPTPPKPDPLAQFRSRSGEEVPFAEGSPRIRTPYTSLGGEKTYFSNEALRRSASTRDHSRRPQSSEHAAAPNGSPRSNTARHRSASPNSRKAHQESPRQEAEAGWQAPRFGTNSAQSRPRRDSKAKFQMHVSSDESDEESENEPVPHHSKRTERSSAPEPQNMSSNSPYSHYRTDFPPPSGDSTNRLKAEPSPSWARSNGTYSRKGQFSSQVPGGTRVDGDAKGPSMNGLGQKSNSTMYEQSFPTSESELPSTITATQWAQRWPFGGVKDDEGAQRPPYWAYPSSVAPPKVPKFAPLPHKRSASRQAGPSSAKAFPFFPSFEAWQSRPDGHEMMDEHVGHSQEAARSSTTMRSSSKQQEPANVTSASSFSFQNHSFVPQPPDSRSKSTESINTKFSPGEWNGKFESTSSDYFVPPASRKGSRSRSSPVHGPTPVRPPSVSQQSPVNGTQAHPFGTPSGTSQLPPPPPLPPSLRTKEPTFAPPPPEQVRFSPDAWAQTIRDPSLFFPPPKPPSPVRPGSVSARRPKTPRGRAHTTGSKLPTAPKPASVSEMDDESDVPNRAPGTVESLDEEAVEDDYAMDIDATPPQPNSSRAHEPRLVPVQPTRPEWRDQQPSTSTQHPVPPPPPPPQRQPDLALNELKNVAPFAPSHEGLNGLKTDLASTLPFESRPSPAHPAKPQAPQPLQLPRPPKAPQPPAATERLAQAAWSAYRTHMRAYMAEWNRFNARMLAHFSARQALAERMVEGAGWMEAAGETTGGEGVGSYLRGLREDERVRMHWTVSCERHQDAVEGLEAVRARVAREGLRG